MAKKKKSGTGGGVMANHTDVKRYAVLVLAWVVLSFWLLVVGTDFKTGVVYVMLGLGSLAIYVIVTGIFRK